MNVYMLAEYIPNYGYVVMCHTIDKDYVLDLMEDSDQPEQLRLSINHREVNATEFYEKHRGSKYGL